MLRNNILIAVVRLESFVGRCIFDSVIVTYRYERTICGRFRSLMITSTSNTLGIRFQSDATISGRGFRLTYQSGMIATSTQVSVDYRLQSSTRVDFLLRRTINQPTNNQPIKKLNFSLVFRTQCFLTRFNCRNTARKNFI